MKTIKLLAVDLDGPLLVDTFSPIMHEICLDAGVEYTADLERNTFSRNRESVVNYLRDYFSQYDNAHEFHSKSNDEWMEYYFEKREKYKIDNITGMINGADSFLKSIKDLDVRAICYGGFPSAYMDEELGSSASIFEDYVCTDKFRPGVKEIVQDLYHLKPHEVLFIDDVNIVAEHAKQIGCPFIGIPSLEPWSWQKQDMISTGVEYIYDSVEEIDPKLLLDIDKRAANFWSH